MLRNDNPLLTGGLAAWNTLTAHPADRSGAADLENPLALAFFPLLGAAFALLPYLAGKLIAWVCNPVAGALVFAAGAVVLLEWRDRGESSRLLSRSVALKLTGAEADGRTPLLLVALRFGVLALLGYHGASGWLVVAVAGGFTVQGALGMLELNGSAPVLDAGKDGWRALLGAAAVVGLGSLMAFPMGTVAAAAAAYLLVRESERQAARRNAASPETWITFWGALAENTLLLLGLFFAF